MTGDALMCRAISLVSDISSTMVWSCITLILLYFSARFLNFSAQSSAEFLCSVPSLNPQLCAQSSALCSIPLLNHQLNSQLYFSIFSPCLLSCQLHTFRSCWQIRDLLTTLTLTPLPQPPCGNLNTASLLEDVVLAYRYTSRKLTHQTVC